MPYIATSPDKLMDDLANSDDLVRKVPGHEEMLDGVREIREASEQLATISNWGKLEAADQNMKRVASIPQYVLQLALVYQPDLLMNKKKFFAWLDRHPEYFTYNRRKGKSRC